MYRCTLKNNPLEFTLTFTHTHTSHVHSTQNNSVEQCWPATGCYQTVTSFLSLSGRANLPTYIFDSSKHKKGRSPATFPSGLNKPRCIEIGL